MLSLVIFVSPSNATAPPGPPKPRPAVLNPALVRVCTCESGQGTGQPQQYDVLTGNVLHGHINPKDIGMCQVNEYWNGEAATKMGWDIYTEDGNIRMANYLYETQGLGPWGWSKACWGRAS